jgi:hypothetical protein
MYILLFNLECGKKKKSQKISKNLKNVMKKKMLNSFLILLKTFSLKVFKFQK